jgi:parallel beta-helix repeat protein
MHRSNNRPRNIFENLEKRVLLAQINVNDFGARANDGGDDYAAIVRAFDAAREGDTVVFGEGTYNVSKHIHYKSNRTYRGSGSHATRLKFNLPSSSTWGSKVWPDSNNVTVENFVFDGGGLGMSEGRMNNITIKNNEWVNTPQDRWNGEGPAIYAGVANDGLKILNNVIRDHDKYGIILFNSDNLTIRNNTLRNLRQGMHILNPGRNIDVSYNLLTGMVRMGIEMQRHGSRTAENVLVEGNVLKDWRRPYYDSFGLSIVPDGSTNVRVKNNYIQGVPRNWNGEWGNTGNEGRRMGYAIEYGSRNGEVTGNIIGGAFCNYVSVSGGGGLHSQIIPVHNNKFYGVPSWTDWIWKQSYTNNGFGYSDQGNLKDPNFGNMPGAPNAGADFNNTGGSGNEGGGGSGGGGTPGGGGGGSTDGDFDWLSDLNWNSVRNGHGAVERNRSNGELSATDGKQMRINGTTFDKGLGVHADSEIVYRVDQKYKTFTAKVGVDDEVNASGSVTFEIWADGRRIYDSGRVTGRDAAKDVNVDVRGVRELKFIVTSAGDGKNYDHADWANAKLIDA